MSLLEKSQENILLNINILSLHGNIWGDFYFNPCSFSSNVLYIKKTFFFIIYNYSSEHFSKGNISLQSLEGTL